MANGGPNRLESYRTNLSKLDYSIRLEDQTRVADERLDAERNDSDASTNLDENGQFSLTKRLTSNSVQLQQSLKRELTKRKYAKFDRSRYNADHSPDSVNEVPENQPQPGDVALPQQVGALERGRSKAKKLLKRKRNLGGGHDKDDYVIDILYENQRGAFLFGVPRYSASSLLPPDPKPWQNGQFRTSPVDIRNAQVPDPSWEWVWRSWYVDMSRDVDEEGWEYSLQFRGGWAWHGNHPWFHSFVRRRRWLRMRKRRDAVKRTQDRAHEMTAEYFTIHPRSLRPASEDWSRAPSLELANALAKMEEEPEAVDKMEIASIGALFRALKAAAVDREKLVAVRKFIEGGGDELYYLSEHMPAIMAHFTYQSSRRQLLADLLRRFDSARTSRNSLDKHQHDEPDAQDLHDLAAQRMENLMKAVKAADELVEGLEYWSDIKEMSKRGETLQDDEEGRWDLSRWQGLLSPTAGPDSHPSQPFANKQAASEGIQDLRSRPEPAKPPEPIKSPESGSIWYDAPQMQTIGSAMKEAEEVDLFTTASESASQSSHRGGKVRRKKGKGKARVTGGLDGVAERGEDDDDEDNAGYSTAEEGEDVNFPDLDPSAKKKTVQMVEPVPEHEPLTTTADQPR